MSWLTGLMSLARVVPPLVVSHQKIQVSEFRDTGKRGMPEQWKKLLIAENENALKFANTATRQVQLASTEALLCVVL